MGIHAQEKLTCRVVSRPPGLGPNDLLLAKLHGVEAISQPYRLRIEFRSAKPDLAHANIAGQQVGLEIKLEGDEKRYFHGFFERFSQGETDQRVTSYFAEVVPFLGLLQRRSDSRVFQDRTALEIVKQVIKDAGFDGMLEDSTSKTPPKLPYCAQYRETDFTFVSRLLEEEGIVYWFRHFGNKHVMVLADGISGHAKGKKVPFGQRSSETGRLGEAWVRERLIDKWRADYEVRSGKWEVKDYDFANPETSLKAEESTSPKLARFDYPTRHETAERGKARAKLRMEIEEAAAFRHSGEGSSLEFGAGSRFTLEKHDRKDFNQEYLLTSVTHTLEQGIETGEGGTQYSNAFSCIAANVPYRAPIATPRPVVQGVQTAIVTGPDGEELHVDEHGRVKVQFHWDRVGGKDDKSSYWVRVAQTHASGGFGGAFWPRIGDEVVVSFEEGDPDHPIITGRVYNGKNKPPYKLPDHVTRSALKTRSTKGGGEENFNELRFEDKMGDEHLFLHAEKDRFEHTKGERHAKVVKDEYLAVDGKQHSEVKGEVVAKFGAAHEVEVTADRKEKIGGNHHVQVGMDRHTKVMKNEALEAGMQMHLKAGMTLVVEAGMQLTLKAGAGFITIGPDGVSISGPMVKLNSGGAAGSGSGAQPQAPASPTAPKEAPK